MSVVKILMINCILFKLGIAYMFQKPLTKTLSTDRCSRNEYRLNNCNWCYCKNTRYKCEARVCDEVDMFGHFNDAIQDIKVGMEGHGVWRSEKTVCDPGVQYEKGDLICICTERGTWPNPTCRDTFRVLHSVEITELSKFEEPIKASNSSCTPTKLYLIGCNVCYCPSSGQIDAELCTKTECSKDDPALHLKDGVDSKPDGLEVYAECDITKTYTIGCMNCVCLRNNRLVCESCSEDGNSTPTELSLCANKTPKEMFNLDCNICSCDEIGLIYCTTKKCLKSEVKQSIEIVKTTENNLRSSNRPILDADCVPGTSFMKDCNRCFCNLLDNGKKTVGCTLKFCSKSNDVLRSMKQDCVLGTVYQSRCLTCRCDLVDGEKRETCLMDSECGSPDNTKTAKHNNLESSNGYCEPEHVYSWNCNTCRCLSDGKTVVCSSKLCVKGKKKPNEKKPIIVDIIAVKQPVGRPCPKDHVYQIGCNTCYCIDSGDAICTMKTCE